MILHLCRHASAADATGAMTDAERPLTAEGIRKFRAAAAGFVSLEPEVSHILSSPLLRARQTAELLADAFAQRKHAVEVDVLECLGTDASERALETLVRTVRGFKQSQAVVAVGHEPTLSAWIGRLCFGTATGSCLMKKGGVAAIELAERGVQGTLLALTPPRHLRAMG